MNEAVRSSRIKPPFPSPRKSNMHTEKRYGPRSHRSDGTPPRPMQIERLFHSLSLSFTTASLSLTPPPPPLLPWALEVRAGDPCPVHIAHPTFGLYQSAFHG